MPNLSLSISPSSVPVMRRNQAPAPLPLLYKWTITSSGFDAYSKPAGNPPAFGDSGSFLGNIGFIRDGLGGYTPTVYYVETGPSIPLVGFNGAVYDHESGGFIFSNDNFVYSVSMTDWEGYYQLDIYYNEGTLTAAMDADDNGAVIALVPFTELGDDIIVGTVESDYTNNDALRWLASGTMELTVVTPTLRYRWTLATVSGNCFGLVGAPGDVPTGDDGGGISGTCYFDLEDDGIGGYTVVGFAMGTTDSDPGPQFPAVDYAGGSSNSPDTPACHESVLFQDTTLNSIFGFYWAPGALAAAMAARVDGTLVPLLSYPDGTTGNTAEYDAGLDLNRYLNSGSTLGLTVLYIYP